MAWLYVSSVMAIVECPRRAETTLGEGRRRAQELRECVVDRAGGYEGGSFRERADGSEH